MGTFVVLLAAVAFGISQASVGATGGGGPRGIHPELVKRLKDEARGSVSISTKKSTNHASFVRVGLNGDLLPGNSRGPRGKALGFFAKYGGLFGIRDTGSELVEAASFTDQYGATHVSYKQMYKGVPVFGGIVRAHVDAKNNLTALNGVFVPDLNLSTSPKLSATAAGTRAVAEVVANPPRTDATADSSSPLSAADLSVAGTTLYVYRVGLVRDAPGTNQLVYEVEVTNRADVREFVFVNAHSGKIVNRYSAVHSALFRRLFEETLDNQVWQEGDPFPGALNEDQQNIVNFSGHTYFHFFNAFGRDSYDGAGAELQSVNNDPRISCPNANWNGLTTNYCTGVTGDDTVAHEWGHAYTDYTHDLIYQWQPGALNEAYSDIWGDVVDLINGAGTDSPGGVRSVGACSTFTTPLPVVDINSPAAIAGECAANRAAFGPQLTETGITDNVVLADDGRGATTDACSRLRNGAQVSGNIALVDRGICTFVEKVANAQRAGAVAVIVANNVPGGPSSMGGSDPTITIPSVMISQAHGNLIKSELGKGQTVNVTMRLDAGDREASYRWLSGEDDPAFGGAIRDMWEPTCLGDPGKVTDQEYFCGTADGGGVHTNSGVPNHGFALLVDGGTYNGQTVNGMGLTKAAHLYWRAQSVYQTPTSDFADHADSLETSCNDLIGLRLNNLSTASRTAGGARPSITAGDCASVTAMIAAVEFRTDPTAQCKFQPNLKQNPPPICGSGTGTEVFTEDFEDGLSGWALANQGVFSGWPGLDWVHDGTLPGGRSGSGAFAADPDIGDCSGGAGDVSGHMTLTSPVIAIPSGRGLVPRVSFMHYFATEAGWDGGNVKVSVNGGAFRVVPASAFIFNPYNATLNTAAEGNTNPLAGQPGFTGTDGGQVFGSWGQSQIDLSVLRVRPGDSIRLQFDFGMDGCTGVDGWYVDDVKLTACNLTAAASTVTAKQD